jgi:hypothetical protein
VDINRTQQVSPILSAQRTANDHSTAILKLANEQIEAEGQAALKLIAALPQANDRVGNILNVSV